jgi:hypothetical protein
MLTGYGLLDIWLEAIDFGMQACACLQTVLGCFEDLGGVGPGKFSLDVL